MFVDLATLYNRLVKLAQQTIAQAVNTDGGASQTSAYVDVDLNSIKRQLRKSFGESPSLVYYGLKRDIYDLNLVVDDEQFRRFIEVIDQFGRHVNDLSDKSSSYDFKGRVKDDLFLLNSYMRLLMSYRDQLKQDAADLGTSDDAIERFADSFIRFNSTKWNILRQISYLFKEVASETKRIINSSSIKDEDRAAVGALANSLISLISGIFGLDLNYDDLQDLTKVKAFQLTAETIPGNMSLYYRDLIGQRDKNHPNFIRIRDYIVKPIADQIAQSITAKTIDQSDSAASSASTNAPQTGTSSSPGSKIDIPVIPATATDIVPASGAQQASTPATAQPEQKEPEQQSTQLRVRETRIYDPAMTRRFFDNAVKQWVDSILALRNREWYKAIRERNYRISAGLFRRPYDIDRRTIMAASGLMLPRLEIPFKIREYKPPAAVGDQAPKQRRIPTNYANALDALFEIEVPTKI